MGKRTDKPLPTPYTTFNPNLLQTRNNLTRNRQALNERFYIRVLTELCTNRFKWTGLPDTIDERYLELSLFRNALVVFYWHEDYSRHLVSRASGNGTVNMYDNPTSFTVVTPQFSKTLGPKECVPIWANYLRSPDLDIVLLYANKLAKIDRTIDITIDNMRHPKIIFTGEDQRTSWQNMIRQIDEGVPVVYATNALNVDDLNQQATVLDFGVHHDMLDRLMIGRTRLWNECMGLLGINNANQDKKERLVADEVNANDEQVTAMRNVALNARRQACEQINRLFDMSINVQFNTEIDSTPLSFSGGNLELEAEAQNSEFNGDRIE